MRKFTLQNFFAWITMLLILGNHVASGQIIEDFDPPSLTWTTVSGDEGFWEIGQPNSPGLWSSINYKQGLGFALDGPFLRNPDSVYSIQSSAVTVPDLGTTTYLEFFRTYSMYSVDHADLELVKVSDSSVVKHYISYASGDWDVESFDVTDLAGQQVYLRFVLGKPYSYQRDYLTPTALIDRISFSTNNNRAEEPIYIYQLQDAYSGTVSDTLRVPIKLNVSDFDNWEFKSSDQSVVSDDQIGIVRSSNASNFYELQLVPSQTGTAVIDIAWVSEIDTLHKSFEAVVGDFSEFFCEAFDSTSGLKWRETPRSSGIWQIGYFHENRSYDDKFDETDAGLGSVIAGSLLPNPTSAQVESTPIQLPVSDHIELNLNAYTTSTGYCYISLVDETGHTHILDRFNYTNQFYSWTELKYDLTDFSGQAISIQFEIITTSSGMGYYFDDLCISTRSEDVLTNTVPTLRALPTISMATPVEQHILIDAFDPDGDELTYEVSSSNEAFLPESNMEITQGDGVKVLSLLPAGLGESEVTITVSDGLASASTAFKVEVLSPGAALDSAIVANWSNEAFGEILSSPIAEWPFVKVNSEGRVVQLEIDADNVCSIPVEIEFLNALDTLTIAGQVSGAIPFQIGELENLRFFSVYGSKVGGKLPSEIGDLTELRDLNLGYCGLRGPLPIEISLLTKLQRLNLSNSKFYVPFPDFLKSLTNLEYLNLNSSQFFGVIPDDFFENFIHLEYLTMKYLREIEGPFPSSIGLDTSLTYLNISKSRFESLPESIGDLHNLVELYMDLMWIRVLPTSIGRLDNLTHLDASWNGLKEIPEEIGDMESLQSLNLEVNQLTQIPSSIGQLSTLRYLYLNSNDLTVLTDSINGLSSLSRLEVGSNQLTEIPDDLSGMTALTYLTLSGNPFGTIPEAVNTIPDLSTLRLTSIEMDSMTWLKEGIRSLDIRSNYLDFEELHYAVDSLEIQFVSFHEQRARFEDTTVYQDEGTTFSISASEIRGGANHYEWYFNEVLIDSITSPVLEFENIDSTYEGIYTCLVKNDSFPTVFITRGAVELIVNKAGNTTVELEDTTIISYNPNVSFKTIYAGPVEDEDGDLLTYSFANDVYEWAFRIQGANIQVYFSGSVRDTLNTLVVNAEDEHGAVSQFTITYIVRDTTEQVDEVLSMVVSSSFIDPSTHFYLPENATDGTILKSFAARPDTTGYGYKYSYRISSGNHEDAFAIDEETGEIWVNDRTKIDFETYPFFTLDIDAYSQVDSVQSVGTEFYIYLEDDVLEEFNRAPIILNKEFTVLEGTPLNTIIGNMDADDPEGEQLVYRILKGNFNETFDLSTEGEILVASQEALSSDSIEFFLLRIEVEDPSGRYSRATAKIDLELITGLNNDSESLEFYPNPANEWVMITLEETIDKVSVYDLNGRVVMETASPKVNLTELDQGTYVIRVKAGGKVHSRSVIKF
jgi:Leucine-rich repeat (LRR) protein